MEVGLHQLTDTLFSLWLRERRRFSKKDMKGFDTFVSLVCRRLWKQKNARVFQDSRGPYSVVGLVEQILADWKLWRDAGLGVNNSFARVVH